MYQKSVFIGNLGRDPEMRYTPSGQQVTNFSMAATEKWTGQDGQPHEKTLWVRVTCWGKMGEACNTYLKKGSKVYVEGKLQGDESGNPRIWTRQDGTPAASFEVTASTVKFLDRKPADGSAVVGGEVEAVTEKEEIPF